MIRIANGSTRKYRLRRKALRMGKKKRTKISHTNQESGSFGTAAVPEVLPAGKVPSRKRKRATKDVASQRSCTERQPAVDIVHVCEDEIPCVVRKKGRDTLAE